MTTFELTEEHCKLLSHAYVRWLDVEHGAPCIDPKRPFGNSDVARDVAELLGWPMAATEDDDHALPPGTVERAERIVRELVTALQIMLVFGEALPGTYLQTDPYDPRSWTLWRPREGADK